MKQHSNFHETSATVRAVSPYSLSCPSVPPMPAYRSADFGFEVFQLVQKVHPELDVRLEEVREVQDPSVVFVHALEPRRIRASCGMDGPKLKIQFHAWSKVADSERVVRQVLRFDAVCSICWEQWRGGSICGSCGVMMCANCWLQYNEGSRPYECHHCQTSLKPDMMRPIADRLKAERDERLRADKALQVSS